MEFYLRKSLIASIFSPRYKSKFSFLYILPFFLYIIMIMSLSLYHIIIIIISLSFFSLIHRFIHFFPSSSSYLPISLSFIYLFFSFLFSVLFTTNIFHVMLAIIVADLIVDRVIENRDRVLFRLALCKLNNIKRRLSSATTV